MIVYSAASEQSRLISKIWDVETILEQTQEATFSPYVLLQKHKKKHDIRELEFQEGDQMHQKVVLDS